MASKSMAEVTASVPLLAQIRRGLAEDRQGQLRRRDVSIHRLQTSELEPSRIQVVDRRRQIVRRADLLALTREPMTYHEIVVHEPVQVTIERRRVGTLEHHREVVAVEPVRLV